MTRREFMKLFGGAAIAWPLDAPAQSSSVPVLGFLSPTPLSGVWLPLEAAFRQGLSDSGYTEGRNMRIEGRWVDGQYDQLPALYRLSTFHQISSRGTLRSAGLGRFCCKTRSNNERDRMDIDAHTECFLGGRPLSHSRT
jgi:hypothetical protein